MKPALFAVLLIASPALAADPIPSTQAKDHLGETATVCGKVADARYQETGSRVTFLNFDNPYPDHSFTGFIAAENRGKFGAPEKDFLGKEVCVTGKIVDYRGKPEIVLAEADQIKLQSK